MNHARTALLRKLLNPPANGTAPDQAIAAELSELRQQVAALTESLARLSSEAKATQAAPVVFQLPLLPGQKLHKKIERTESGELLESQQWLSSSRKRHREFKRDASGFIVETVEWEDAVG